MSTPEESSPSVDTRTRRQVEHYRSQHGSRNGAQALLSVVKAVPTYNDAKAEVPRQTTRVKPPTKKASRLLEIQGIVDDIECMGQTFAVREIAEGFLISAGDRQWFVPPYTSEEDIVETVFIACLRTLHDRFTFRGLRVFPHRSDRGTVPAAVPAKIPARSMQGKLAVTVAPRESERVVKIIQLYFKVSRDLARKVVRGGRSQEFIPVEAFQVADLNARLARKHLHSSVHMTGCPKA